MQITQVFECRVFPGGLVESFLPAPMSDQNGARAAAGLVRHVGDLAIRRRRERVE